MSKIDELHDLLSDNITKIGGLGKKEEQAQKNSKTLWIFAIVGVVVFVAAAAYGLYRFFAPDYLEDFEDDFDEDFEDDFFEDEEESEESEETEESKETEESEESDSDADDEEDTVTDEMTEE